MVAANLQYLTVNLAKAKVRRVILNGRPYLVAPASLIVPGVLNGSDGALYYPPEEAGKTPHIWNQIPIVVYHPQVMGEAVSASHDHPSVVESRIGFLKNASYKDHLVSEAWFDEELTKNYDVKLAPDIRIHPRLTRNEPIELSTGLHVDREPTPGFCPRTGRGYDAIARNYRPDHLAVLPDQKGACNIDDGCGIFMNMNPNHDEQGRFAESSSTARSEESKAATDKSRAADSATRSASTATQHLEAAKLHRQARDAHTSVVSKGLSNINKSLVDAHAAADIHHHQEMNWHKDAAKALKAGEKIPQRETGVWGHEKETKASESVRNQDLMNMNPNHDEKGRFSSGEGESSSIPQKADRASYAAHRATDKATAVSAAPMADAASGGQQSLHQMWAREHAQHAAGEREAGRIESAKLHETAAKLHLKADNLQNEVKQQQAKAMEIAKRGSFSQKKLKDWDPFGKRTPPTGNEDFPMTTESTPKSLWQKLGEMLGVTNAVGKYGNPQHGDTGKFQPHGSGTGKGEVHKAAVAGHADSTIDVQTSLSSVEAAEEGAVAKTPNVVAQLEERAGKGPTENETCPCGRTCDSCKGTMNQELGETIAINKEKDMPLTATERKAMVTGIVANCDCKEEERGYAKEIANKLSDATLLRLNAFPMKKSDDPEEDDDNDEEDKMENNSGTTDKNVMASTPPPSPTIVGNMKKGKTMTDKEWLESAPPTIRSAVTNAMKIERKAKEDVIARLVGNAEEGKRESLGKYLSNKTLEELEVMADLMPTTNRQPVDELDHLLSPIFMGAGSIGDRVTGNSAVANAADDEEASSMVPGSFMKVKVSNEEVSQARQSA